MLSIEAYKQKFKMNPFIPVLFDGELQISQIAILVSLCYLSRVFIQVLWASVNLNLRHETSVRQKLVRGCYTESVQKARIHNR